MISLTPTTRAISPSAAIPTWQPVSVITHRLQLTVELSHGIDRSKRAANVVVPAIEYERPSSDSTHSLAADFQFSVETFIEIAVLDDFRLGTDDAVEQKVSLLKVSFDTAGPHEKGIEFKAGCCGADPATPVGLRCGSREKDIGASGQRARQEIAQLERFVPTEIEPGPVFTS